MPPPIPTAATASTRASHRGFYVLGALLLSLAFAVFGITGYFRLSSTTQTLRDSLLASLPGQCHKKLALRVGFCTTALVRIVAQVLKLEPEAKAALQSVRGAEFGLYQLDGVAAGTQRGWILTQADKAMLRCGWQRAIGVINEHEMVAIYVPGKGLSTRNVKCALVVLQDRQLIVAGVRGNLKPLAEIVARRFELATRTALARR